MQSQESNPRGAVVGLLPGQPREGVPVAQEKRRPDQPCGRVRGPGLSARPKHCVRDARAPPSTIVELPRVPSSTTTSKLCTDLFSHAVGVVLDVRAVRLQPIALAIPHRTMKGPLVRAWPRWRTVTAVSLRPAVDTPRPEISGRRRRGAPGVDTATRRGEDCNPIRHLLPIH